MSPLAAVAAVLALVGFGPLGAGLGAFALEPGFEAPRLGTPGIAAEPGRSVDEASGDEQREVTVDASVAPALDPGAGQEAVRYDWPAPGEVTAPFDPPDQPWLAGHRGVDLAASPGEVVRAAADGVVAFAGSVAGKPVVSIDHADGVRTTYEPVVATVRAGDAVVLGGPIGLLSAGHGSDDLHWGARRGRIYLDPTLLIAPEVVIRLYPVPARR